MSENVNIAFESGVRYRQKRNKRFGGILKLCEVRSSPDVQAVPIPCVASRDPHPQYRVHRTLRSISVRDPGVQVVTISWVNFSNPRYRSYSYTLRSISLPDSGIQVVTMSRVDFSSSRFLAGIYCEVSAFQVRSSRSVRRDNDDRNRHSYCRFL